MKDIYNLMQCPTKLHSGNKMIKYKYLLISQRHGKVTVLTRFFSTCAFFRVCFLITFFDKRSTAFWTLDLNETAFLFMVLKEV